MATLLGQKATKQNRIAGVLWRSRMPVVSTARKDENIWRNDIALPLAPSSPSAVSLSRIRLLPDRNSDSGSECDNSGGSVVSTDSSGVLF
jgi:hypothetical protein